LPKLIFDNADPVDWEVKMFDIVRVFHVAVPEPLGSNATIELRRLWPMALFEEHVTDMPLSAAVTVKG